MPWNTFLQVAVALAALAADESHHADPVFDRIASETIRFAARERRLPNGLDELRAAGGMIDGETRLELDAAYDRGLRCAYGVLIESDADDAESAADDLRLLTWYHTEPKGFHPQGELGWLLPRRPFKYEWFFSVRAGRIADTIDLIHAKRDAILEVLTREPHVIDLGIDPQRRIEPVRDAWRRELRITPVLGIGATLGEFRSRVLCSAEGAQKFAIYSYESSSELPKDGLVLRKLVGDVASPVTIALRGSPFGLEGDRLVVSGWSPSGAIPDTPIGFDEDVVFESVTPGPIVFTLRRGMGIGERSNVVHKWNYVVPANEPGATTIDLRLTRIAGRVSTSIGVHSRDFHRIYRLRQDDDGDEWLRYDGIPWMVPIDVGPDGEFHAYLSPGRHQVTIRMGSKDHSFPIEVVAGRERLFRFEIP
jgi:hypothetical protein